MVSVIGEPYLDAIEPWHEQAACATYSAEVFFPPSDVPGAARAAKAICASCPVQSECLAFALDTGQPEGVWGGMDAGERRRLRRRIRDRARRKAS
jgi:WhiB family redox-sensing transcriptional regulator